MEAAVYELGLIREALNVIAVLGAVSTTIGFAGLITFLIDRY